MSARGPTHPRHPRAGHGRRRSTEAVRSPDRIADFFHGLEILEPGVVRTSAWRPDPGAGDPDILRGHAVCGVGRKP
ncbi:SAM-dependent methyltransferase [Streptomyces sp. ITFR-6]|uniref:SAM-dependent methyltransferase n=1 Tax=Streptomyces sp. ITFR-6 TaxID=3075197 RepID=UPI00288C3E82|nr:SAM-dependent methyltransferase [Streptomyces sp. ITFR-6]WNI34241.1 SAM-dependent methyltransferase [Streptomyces sp. ITFR-6]